MFLPVALEPVLYLVVALGTQIFPEFIHFVQDGRMTEARIGRGVGRGVVKREGWELGADWGKVIGQQERTLGRRLFFPWNSPSASPSPLMYRHKSRGQNEPP